MLHYPGDASYRQRSSSQTIAFGGASCSRSAHRGRSDTSSSSTAAIPLMSSAVHAAGRLDVPFVAQLFRETQFA